MCALEPLSLDLHARALGTGQCETSSQAALMCLVSHFHYPAKRLCTVAAHGNEVLAFLVLFFFFHTAALSEDLPVSQQGNTR